MVKTIHVPCCDLNHWMTRKYCMLNVREEKINIAGINSKLTVPIEIYCSSCSKVFSKHILICNGKLFT